MDTYFQGVACWHTDVTLEYLMQAREFFARALALDPGFNLHRYRMNALSDSPVYLDGREHSCWGVRLAGVPER
jgi:hypothetical protein